MRGFVCEGAKSKVKKPVPSLSHSSFSAFLLVVTKAHRENPDELQLCLNGQTAEIRPSLPAIQ